MSTETNRYGEPLKLAKLEEVVADLEKLPAGLIAAICASLLMAHEPYTCRLLIAEIWSGFKDEFEGVSK